MGRLTQSCYFDMFNTMGEEVWPPALGNRNFKLCLDSEREVGGVRSREERGWEGGREGGEGMGERVYLDLSSFEKTIFSFLLSSYLLGNYVCLGHHLHHIGGTEDKVTFAVGCIHRFGLQEDFCCIAISTHHFHDKQQGMW